VDIDDLVRDRGDAFGIETVFTIAHQRLAGELEEHAAEDRPRRFRRGALHGADRLRHRSSSGP
jgi:hypothetical protein